jgi:hypothetical protein
MTSAQANGGDIVSFRRKLSHSWTPIDLVALGAEAPEPPRLGRIAYPGRRHIWSGEPEALKTWLSLCVAADEIRSGSTVFYVDFENGAREILSRLRSLGLENGDISSRFVYLNPNGPIDDAIGDLDDLLVQRQPSVVFVDAFAGACELHRLDDNSTRDVETFYRTVVDPLRAHGAAVVILDHLAKNSETRGRWAIGSQRKVGGADVHLGLEIVEPFGRGRTGKAKLLTHKDRPGYLPRPKTGEFELVSDGETQLVTWRITLAEGDQGEAPVGGFRPTCLMERVSRYLEGQTDAKSRTEIRNAVSGNDAAILVAIDCLSDEGYAVLDERTQGSRKFRYYASSRPFREARDMGVGPVVPDSAPVELSTTSGHRASPLLGGTRPSTTRMHQ